MQESCCAVCKQGRAQLYPHRHVNITFNACELVVIQHECTKGGQASQCKPACESIMSQVEHLWEHTMLAAVPHRPWQSSMLCVIPTSCAASKH